MLVDQHAAHERVAFERLKREFHADSVESQSLLFPETIELAFNESAALRDNVLKIKKLGFEVENFGGNTWALTAIPRLLENREYVRIFRDIIEEILDLGRSSSFDDACDEILSRLACHSVIRGGMQLTLPEIHSLFSQLDAIDFSSNCPHGRPVSNRLTLSDIEKMFRRG